MRIQELLSDDELYELSLLMVEVIWQALMAQSIPKDVKEGVWRQSVRRVAPRPIIRPVASARYVARPKPLPKPKPLYAKPQPVKKPAISPSQTSGINPKIDFMKGPNFKLDNFNPIPPMTDQSRKIYGTDKLNKGQKKSSF